METHIDSHLAAIERDVRLSEKDGKPVASVQLTRHFDVNRRALWHAVTSKKEIAKWFSTVTGDLKPGGAYAIEGNAHGVIEACEPLAHVALTWEFGGDVSWIDLRADIKSRTGVVFSLNHTSMLSPHWDQYGAGATGVGWELSFLSLFLYLMYPDEAKIDEEAFVASDEGKHLVSTSSQGWAEASILAGTETEAAYAAAERTTSFYLGI